jgi:hypothetical protein
MKGIMKKLLAFILLTFSLSANAQFGDLFKGLEKLAKDIEGGTQQQQAQPSNPQQTQTEQTTKLNSGISSGLLNLFVGRWSTEEICLNNSFNKFGTFISVKDNQLIAEQMLAKTQGGQPELIRKFVFINGKILNDEQKIYELSGILEDYLTSKQTEFIQTIKFENNYTRSTIKLIDAGKTTVDNGIIISSGQPNPKSYNCNHKEMIAKVSSNQKTLSEKNKKITDANLIMDLVGVNLYSMKMTFETGKPQWDFNTKFGAPPVSHNHIKYARQDIPAIWKKVSPCYKNLSGNDLNETAIKKFIAEGSTQNAKEMRELINLVQMASVVKAPKTNKELNGGPENELLLRNILGIFEKQLDALKRETYCEDLIKILK